MRMAKADKKRSGKARKRGFFRRLASALLIPVIVVLMFVSIYVGPRGLTIPDVGKPARLEIRTPRKITCTKPNPDYKDAVKKAVEQVTPVYFVDNSHLDSRKKNIRQTFSKLDKLYSKLADTEKKIRQLENRPAQEVGTIKTSRFYKGSSPTRGTVQERRTSTKEQLRLLNSQRIALRGQIGELFDRVLFSSRRFGLDKMIDYLSKREIRFQTEKAILHLLSIESKWLIGDFYDQQFQKELIKGIWLKNRKRYLTQRDIIYVPATAAAAVNEAAEKNAFDERYPAVWSNRLLRQFVLDAAKAGLRPNIVRDDKATNERLTAARQSVPRTINIEFLPGQVVIPAGETVQEWQRTCVLAQMGKIHFQSGQVATNIDWYRVALLGGLLLFIIGFIILSRRLLDVFAVQSRPWRLKSEDVRLLVFLLLLNLGIVRAYLYAGNLISILHPRLDKAAVLAAVPVALGPIITNILVNSGASLILLLGILFSTAILAIKIQVESFGGYFVTYYALWIVTVSAIGIVGTKRVISRGSLASVGLISGLFSAVYWSVVELYERLSLPIEPWSQLAIAGLASGVMTYILAIALLPLLERLWGYITPMRLQEVSSPEYEPLENLREKALGTWQHSEVVRMLAEAAANRIGADVNLVKAGALYHDLGKLYATDLPNWDGPRLLDSPLYFAENKKGNFNPHDQLTPRQSTRIIINHAVKGAEAIRKYRLGRKIEAFALEHHGTTLLEPFFVKALATAREKGQTVLEQEFRYPGPKPQSVETAIVMLADSVEATIHSLQEKTPESIKETVKRIVARKTEDGQLNECPMTIKDLLAVEQSFVDTLISHYHARPAYPAREREEQQTVRLKTGRHRTQEILDEIRREEERQKEKIAQKEEQPDGSAQSSDGPSLPVTATPHSFSHTAVSETLELQQENQESSGQEKQQKPDDESG